MDILVCGLPEDKNEKNEQTKQLFGSFYATFHSCNWNNDGLWTSAAFIAQGRSELQKI